MASLKPRGLSMMQVGMFVACLDAGEQGAAGTVGQLRAGDQQRAVRRWR